MRVSRITAVALFCLPLVAYAEPRYTITALAPIASPALSTPGGLNENGLVVGAQANEPESMVPWCQPILWQAGTAVPLALPSGWQGYADAVNNLGIVAGDAWSDTSNPLPVLWTNNRVQMLDTLGTGTGYVNGINNQGNVVGTVVGQNGSSTYAYSVMWSNGQAIKLGDFPTGSQAYAAAINNNNQVTLDVSYAGHSEAFLWSNGNLTPITALGGVGIAARGMNDAGQVVGESVTNNPNQASAAFLWENGITTALPMLPTDLSSGATAINDSGVIVGNADDAQTVHAVVWDDGQCANLNELIPPDSGWSLESATAIADNGSIVGYGMFNGQYEGFLLTPVGNTVPEPASLAMLILGAGIGLRRRL